MGLAAGSENRVLRQTGGVLVVKVPEREELAGTARGANLEGYRDRKDRF